ncbi:hypothetical protein BJ166DRAFT_105441 [Pestalotiopsis sp. NC0098]|nr:hypothetical protein BJ166DRAFT_105441 [Pestalotiopsis sp. NC0098]
MLSLVAVELIGLSACDAEAVEIILPREVSESLSFAFWLLGKDRVVRADKEPALGLAAVHLPRAGPATRSRVSGVPQGGVVTAVWRSDCIIVAFNSALGNRRFLRGYRDSIGERRSGNNSCAGIPHGSVG